MRVRLFVAGALLAGTAAQARAQQCPGSNYVKDACDKSVDLVNFMTPQLSSALAGGNATLGQGGALGGWGHFALELRGSAVNGRMPNLNGVGFSLSGPQASTFTSAKQLVPGVSADVAIGLFKGYPLGVTHVGGIDVLGTLTYLSNFNGGDVTAKLSGGSTKIGFGVRVGVLEESVVAPGVSLTWLKRDLPSISIVGSVQPSGGNPGGSISLNDYSVKTTALRLTAAKNLLFFNLNAGVGQDKYEASSTVMVTVNGLPGGTQTGSRPVDFSMTRTNIFIGTSLNLFVMKVAGELGQVSGGTAPASTNSFGEAAAKSRTYFTLGLRFGM